MWASARWAVTAASATHGSASPSRRLRISVTPKLAALLDYQLSLKTPDAPKGSYDESAAQRGKKLFRDERSVPLVTATRISLTCCAGLTTGCVPPRSSGGRTGPGYAQRTATGMYRTRHCGIDPSRATFHDGSAPDLPAVVNHYDKLFNLHLSAARRRTWSNTSSRSDLTAAGGAVIPHLPALIDHGLPSTFSPNGDSVRRPRSTLARPLQVPEQRAAFFKMIK